LFKLDLIFQNNFITATFLRLRFIRHVSFRKQQMLNPQQQMLNPQPQCDKNCRKIRFETPIGSVGRNLQETDENY